jgi:hypothetical protein
VHLLVQVNTFLTPFLVSLVVMNVLSFLSCSALLLLLLSSRHLRQGQTQLLSPFHYYFLIIFLSSIEGSTYRSESQIPPPPASEQEFFPISTF